LKDFQFPKEKLINMIVVALGDFFVLDSLKIDYRKENESWI
jgi:hypothetical protein